MEEKHGESGLHLRLKNMCGILIASNAERMENYG